MFFAFNRFVGVIFCQKYDEYFPKSGKRVTAYIIGVYLFSVITNFYPLYIGVERTSEGFQFGNGTYLDAHFLWDQIYSGIVVVVIIFFYIACFTRLAYRKVSLNVVIKLEKGVYFSKILLFENTE